MCKEHFTRLQDSWVWRNAHIYGGNNVFNHFERSLLLTPNSQWKVGSGAEWWLSCLSLIRITAWSTLLNGWVKDSARYCHEVHDPSRKFLNRNEPKKQKKETEETNPQNFINYIKIWFVLTYCEQKAGCSKLYYSCFEKTVRFKIYMEVVRVYT